MISSFGLSSLDFVSSFGLSSSLDLDLSSDLSSFLGLESDMVSSDFLSFDPSPNDWLICSEEVNATDNIDDKRDNYFLYVINSRFNFSNK